MSMTYMISELRRRERILMDRAREHIRVSERKDASAFERKIAEVRAERLSAEASGLAWARTLIEDEMEKGEKSNAEG